MDSHAAVARAVNFAANAHRKQKRKDKKATPYINHPLEVYGLIVESFAEAEKQATGLPLPMDRIVEILMAAVLHDTVEDTKVTAEEIEQNFGARVRQLVEQVSDDKHLDPIQRKRLQIEHANSIDGDAAYIKLADKLSNMKSLQTRPPVKWSEERKRGYVIWGMAVVTHLRRVPGDALLRQKLATLAECFGIESNLTAAEYTARYSSDLEKYYATL